MPRLTTLALTLDANRAVKDLVEQLLMHWPGATGWRDASHPGALHEAGLLHLVAGSCPASPRLAAPLGVHRNGGSHRKLVQACA